MSPGDHARDRVPRFSRAAGGSGSPLSRIGDGELGGKASGLVSIRDVVVRELGGRFPSIKVDVPRLCVLTTDCFEAFVERNGLSELLASPPADERIAHAFQQANLPVEVLGDLKALIETVRTPLAVRSSSLLEDALAHPFAGVYGTEMIPNNQPDRSQRFQRLIEAIKLVWASTWLRSARDYIRTTGRGLEEEKMAVVIQDVVGRRFGDRFYPQLSGVARSWNFYPLGRAKPEDGVVSLALGLGKTIVDGGRSWSYCPKHPKAPPPWGSTGDLLKNSQLEFWAVNMGRPPEYDPTRETEYLCLEDLTAADYDGALEHVASTYVARSDRVIAGVGTRGPRVLNFAPLLLRESFPLNDVVKELLALCEQALGAAVEIELALTFPREAGEPALLGFLQVRPMMKPDEQVDVSDGELEEEGLLAVSRAAMGSGVISNLSDVVYVMPGNFEAAATRKIAVEVQHINDALVRAGRPYLLIGFGRWGSSDPWLGIPVDWSQIAGARVIVEATLPHMDVEPSQGTHFFHNITSFRVCYLTVHHGQRPGIDWDWLEARPAERTSDHVRQIRLDEPLEVKVDGRRGRGVIRRRRRGAEAGEAEA